MCFSCYVHEDGRYAVSSLEPTTWMLASFRPLENVEACANTTPEFRTNTNTSEKVNQRGRKFEKRVTQKIK